MKAGTYILCLQHRVFCFHPHFTIAFCNLVVVNPCPAEKIKRPLPLLIFSQSDYLIQIIDINSHTSWQTVQIQISWLLQKPTDLDLHCLQRQGISGFSRTRVNVAFLKKTDKPSSFCSKLPSYLSQQVFAFYTLNSQITDGIHGGNDRRSLCHTRP